MNILLLSAYDAPSHRAWRLGLENGFSSFNWTVLALEPRYFSWRIRGNSLSWAYGQRDLLTRRYDLMIATSVVDVSALKGLVPELASVPTVVYFHENQFAYPLTEHQIASVEPQMVNLYSALAADAVVFNSDYNRRTFMAGVAGLLKKLPDHVPAGLAALLENKSSVIPVPLADDVIGAGAAREREEGSFSIVWNHRWEYDKGPDRLLACLEALPPELDLRVHIVGQGFRQSPPEFTAIRMLLTARGWLGRWGFIENKADYYRLLGQSNAVLSTALHDFQGLAILEGAALGCCPIVPDRLAYREIFADRYRYRSEEDNIALEAKACAGLIVDMVQGRAPENCAARIREGFSWRALGPAYESLFCRVAKSS